MTASLKFYLCLSWNHFFSQFSCPSICFSLVSFPGFLFCLNLNNAEDPQHSLSDPFFFLYSLKETSSNTYLCLTGCCLSWAPKPHLQTTFVPVHLNIPTYSLDLTSEIKTWLFLNPQTFGVIQISYLFLNLNMTSPLVSISRICLLWHTALLLSFLPVLLL